MIRAFRKIGRKSGTLIHGKRALSYYIIVRRIIIEGDHCCDSMYFYAAHFSLSSLTRLRRGKKKKRKGIEKEDDRKIHTVKSIEARPASSLVQSFLQLCACGILGAGLWLRLAYSGYTTLVPHYSFASADSLLLAAGCVTFVIAFFGCCGAWFQSRCMLITVRISFAHLPQAFNLVLLPYSTSVWSY